MHRPAGRRYPVSRSRARQSTSRPSRHVPAGSVEWGSTPSGFVVGMSLLRDDGDDTASLLLVEIRDAAAPTAAVTVSSPQASHDPLTGLPNRATGRRRHPCGMDDVFPSAGAVCT